MSTDDIERITAAELKVYREWLGLSQDRLAELLGVKRLSIYRWETGRFGADGTPYRIPVGVRVEIDELMGQFDDHVFWLIDQFDAADSIPIVTIYRTDEDLWERHPEVKPFGVESWVRIVGQAVSMADREVRVEYLN